jgi:L-ascorbate metabolism protein UlaG (beta-lactamase superfamily)
VQLSIGPVKAVAAYNVQKRFHPKSGAWVGYLVQVDGVAFYHAGDTDAVPEMEGLRPDVALVPIGGLFAMDWRQGAHAVELLRSTLSIPMHYSMLLGGRRAGQRFCEKVGAGSLVLPRG